MKTKHLIFLLAIWIVCFFLPCHAGQAEEEVGFCPKPYIKSIFPWKGRSGSLVIIQGERFAFPQGEVVFTHKNKIAALLFGTEVKAEIKNWTYSRIWVIVPRSAASGPVFVRVHCGSESNKLDFTVNK